MTRGRPMVLLEPATLASPLPRDFVDIDELVEQEERDPAVKQSIARGRKVLASHYYGAGAPKLASFRLQHGWSQKQLADRLGTSQPHVARLEAGEVDPQVSTLMRLAAVLDVDPAALLGAFAAGGKRQ